MLQRVAIDGIKFPRLYIAENAEDVAIAKTNGIPFVKWRHGQEKLVKQLLRPTLEKMFPGINWTAVLGRKVPLKSEVVISHGRDDDGYDAGIAPYDKDEMLEAQLEFDNHVDTLPHEVDGDAYVDEDGTVIRDAMASDSPRYCSGGSNYIGYEVFEEHLNIADYVGDLSSYVDIDALQKLGLLPKFVGDIADCIKRNLNQNYSWTEGYTKKLGYPLGKFNCKQELPNLLIIDVSHSIPDGIAATMLTLADTLREQLNADLIITSMRSGYYPAGCMFPKPQTLRDYYGRSNESIEFRTILEKYIAGREWGYVISFGDSDNPGSVLETNYRRALSMANTKIHCIMHYHTTTRAQTGYARWAKEVCPDADEQFDTSWCRVIKKNYKM